MISSTVDTVIFICDSKDCLFADKPLVGTRNYGVFLNYLELLKISVNDTLLYTEKDFNTVDTIAAADPNVRIVILGKEAEKCVKDLSIPYMFLPLFVSESGSDFEVRVQQVGEFIHDYKNI